MSGAGQVYRLIHLNSITSNSSLQIPTNSLFIKLQHPQLLHSQDSVLAEIIQPPVLNAFQSLVFVPVNTFRAGLPTESAALMTNSVPNRSSEGDRVPAVFQMALLVLILFISCVDMGLKEWTSYCNTKISLQEAGEVSLSDVVDACSAPREGSRRAYTSSQSCYYCSLTGQYSCSSYCVGSSCSYYCRDPRYYSGDPTNNVCTNMCTSSSYGTCRYACDYSTGCDYYCADPSSYYNPARCSVSCVGRPCGSCSESTSVSNTSGVCDLSCGNLELLQRAGQVMLAFGLSCIIVTALILLRLGLLFLFRFVLLRGLVVKIAIWVAAGMWLLGTGVYLIIFVSVRVNTDEVEVGAGLGLAMAVAVMHGISCVLGAVALARIK